VKWCATCGFAERKFKKNEKLSVESEIYGLKFLWSWRLCLIIEIITIRWQISALRINKQEIEDFLMSFCRFSDEIWNFWASIVKKIKIIKDSIGIIRIYDLREHSLYKLNRKWITVCRVFQNFHFLSSESKKIKSKKVPNKLTRKYLFGYKHPQFNSTQAQILNKNP